MPGRKDAAWWRDYRARKRVEQQESKGLQAPQAPQETPQAGVAAGLRAAAESMAGIAGTDVVRDESGAITSLRLTGVSVARPRPSFLAAPDDDCGACGHDRQQYHLPAELPCRGPAPYARGGVCRCPAFVDSSNPF